MMALFHHGFIQEQWIELTSHHLTSRPQRSVTSDSCKMPPHWSSVSWLKTVFTVPGFYSWSSPSLILQVYFFFSFFLRGTCVRDQELFSDIFHCSEGEFLFTLHLKIFRRSEKSVFFYKILYFFYYYNETIQYFIYFIFFTPQWLYFSIWPDLTFSHQHYFSNLISHISRVELRLNKSSTHISFKSFRYLVKFYSCF